MIGGHLYQLYNHSLDYLIKWNRYYKPFFQPAPSIPPFHSQTPFYHSPVNVYRVSLPCVTPVTQTVSVYVATSLKIKVALTSSGRPVISLAWDVCRWVWLTQQTLANDYAPCFQEGKTSAHPADIIFSIYSVAFDLLRRWPIQTFLTTLQKINLKLKN